MEIVNASLDVTRRTHLFSWLQGSFQALIPHEIMVCGIRTGEGEHIQFDHFSSTRYFTDQHLEDATRPNQGVIWRALAAWTKTHKPTFLADDLIKGEYSYHSVPFVEAEGELQKAELKNMATFGVTGHAGVSSFFCFSRIHAPLDAQLAYILQLLVPHLHVVLSRLTIAAAKPMQVVNNQNSAITAREAEILQWVHEGKTNQNIADHLSISALTVKNHVQSILRKLDVQNRSHAAVKAMNLGLIKPVKHRSKSQKKQDTHNQKLKNQKLADYTNATTINSENKDLSDLNLPNKTYADVVISAAQINPELVVNRDSLTTQQMHDFVLANPDKFSKPTSKNTRSKKAKKADTIYKIDNVAQLDETLTNVSLTNSVLTEAELLEKMRAEEKIKRKNRIAIRRKLLIAKGLLKSQGKGNPQTT